MNGLPRQILMTADTVGGVLLASHLRASRGSIAGDL